MPDRRNGEFPSAAAMVNHNLLKLHHVNEAVPQEQWIYWDMGFLVWGAAMLGGGWALWWSGKRETAEVQVS